MDQRFFFLCTVRYALIALVRENTHSPFSGTFARLLILVRKWQMATGLNIRRSPIEKSSLRLAPCRWNIQVIIRVDQEVACIPGSALVNEKRSILAKRIKRYAGTQVYGTLYKALFVGRITSCAG